MGNPPPAHLRQLSQKGSANALGHPKNEVRTGTFDFGQIEAPSRTYSADACCVKYLNGEVSVVFAQYSLCDDDQLESALSLKMHGYYAKQFLKTVSEMSPLSIYQYAERLQFSSDPLIEIIKNPKHVAKFSANIVQLAVTGYDCSLDFYLLSPLAIWKNKSPKNSMPLVPVARIEIRTSLVLGLLDKLTELSPLFPESQDGGVAYHS